MNEFKDRGILLFSKISSENNLYLKILTEKDEIITGLSFGGSSKKKKNIYQIGYFLNIIIKNKNKNFPNSITAELSKPFYHVNPWWAVAMGSGMFAAFQQGIVLLADSALF